MTTISIDQFSVSEDGCYSAFASDLGLRPGQQPVDELGVLWVALAPVSRLATFYLTGLLGRDGQQGWLLRPTAETRAVYPALQGKRMTIFND